MHPIFQAALLRSGIEFSSGDQKLVLLGREATARDSSGAGFKMGLSFRERSFADFDFKNIAIRYRKDHLGKDHSLIPFGSSSLTKPLIRFDFREEWNNLGYGSTPLDPANAFSLSGFFEFDGVEVIADVIDTRTGEKVSDYAWILNSSEQSVLWFNRAVGPVDGYDWVIIEKFFSSYRQGELSCRPVVSEIPFGFQSAFTMRIDCDEAVASGRRLFELYADKNVPFGLAIKTAQTLGADDRQVMADVISKGGSVVSHSHTHAPNWGGSRESAAWEVRESQKILRELDVPGINYDFVVSPFHQNPTYAVQGLKDAGIRGFVGGIICNDPEFLLARAGQVPFVDGIISHSQQCMLHGENIHEAGNSIAVYERAFLQAAETETFFGFLDHPFSAYWYGWESEEERLEVHGKYLDFILAHQCVWRASLVDAMRFLEMKSRVSISRQGDHFRVRLDADERFAGLPQLSLNYRSQKFELKSGGEVLLEA